MSTLRVNTLQDATGNNQPAMPGAAKAWVNFNGTGTVAVREQFNVSSITDNGVGDYTVNFTTALVDANYTAIGIGGDGGNGVRSPGATTYTTSSFRFPVRNLDNGLSDPVFMNVTIFR